MSGKPGTGHAHPGVGARPSPSTGSGFWLRLSQSRQRGCRNGLPVTAAAAAGVEVQQGQHPAEALVHPPPLCTPASAGGPAHWQRPPREPGAMHWLLRSPQNTRREEGPRQRRRAGVAGPRPCSLHFRPQGCRSAAPQRGPGRGGEALPLPAQLFPLSPAAFLWRKASHVRCTLRGLIMWSARAPHGATLRSWDRPAGPSRFGGTSVLVLAEMQGPSRGVRPGQGLAGSGAREGAGAPLAEVGSRQRARKGRPPWIGRRSAGLWVLSGKSGIQKPRHWGVACPSLGCPAPSPSPSSGRASTHAHVYVCVYV